MSTPEMYLIFLLPVIFFLIPAITVVIWMRTVRKKLGYTSFREYYRAIPVTEAQQRDAVNLTLDGIVFCLLGTVFPPLMIVGIFPLYCGARKVLYASLGLGLVDDAHIRDR
jgi:hypothetical protein